MTKPNIWPLVIGLILTAGIAESSANSPQQTPSGLATSSADAAAPPPSKAAPATPTTPAASLSAPPAPLTGKRILLDPGHGGTDPGALRKGITEKSITLAVALSLKDKLKVLGANVELTRQVDQPVPLPVRLADSNSTCPDLFLSIHVNAVSRSTIRGIETYYFGDRSAPLAQTVLTKLSQDLHETAKWSHNRDLFVLDGNQVPATLAEIGYLTNPQTRDLLKTKPYQDKVAAALADSVLAYFAMPGAVKGCQSAPLSKH